MRPVLVRWRGLSIYSYPAMLYVGMVLGLALELQRAYEAGLAAGPVWVATLLLCLVALVGARLLFVVLAWRTAGRAGNVSRLLLDGGAFQYGGLVAVPAAVPILLALGLPFGAFADALAPGVLVTVVFGRLGCLLAGCCAGRATASWAGLELPDDAGRWQRRFPTQLWEAGSAALLVLATLLRGSGWPFPGAIFLGMLAAHATTRFLVAFAREDQRASPGRLTGTQLTSAVIAAGAVAGYGVLTWIR